ncbi:MAG: potassium transporter TrkG [Thermodesulfobacteriota bacterium]
MTLFDSLCHTFGAMATGGFSTENASIGFYHSANIDVVVTIFMIIGGINFAPHFQLFRGESPAQFLLLVCMLVGGCTGSTGGAIKCMRSGFAP